MSIKLLIADDEDTIRNGIANIFSYIQSALIKYYWRPMGRKR